MNIQEIIGKPITTPEFPDPSEIHRSVYGHDSVLVEDTTWNALCHIARLERCTIGHLCAQIERGSGGPPFAPAARYYVMSYVAERLPADIELPPELRFLGALRGWRSVQ
jgi:predicted DNA-binding ribbon-helix-helix protein